MNRRKHFRACVGVSLVVAALSAIALLGCAMFAGLLFSHSSTEAANELHGIALLKGCDSPTNVGEAYICTFQAENVVDTQHDTLTITSLVDVVHAHAGDVTSGDLLLPPTVLTLGGGATCDAGQTICTLPFNASVTLTVSYYTVKQNDPNPLTDNATLYWEDTCTGGTPSPNCPSGQTLKAQAGSQSDIRTPTFTPTDTPTSTPTNTPTATPTQTPTNTPTATPTDTPTATPTNTPTATPTQTPTETPTDTPTPTPTSTGTPQDTDTPTVTPTGTVTPETPTATITPHHRNTPTHTPRPTSTPFSQVSPAAVTPTLSPPSTPTPFHETIALPSSGEGTSGPGGGAAVAAIIAFVGGAILLLESRRVLRRGG